MEITNVAEEPERSYRMAATEVQPYLADDSVVGTWHTHPDSDANLSEEDRVGFLMWPDLVHYIVGRRDGALDEMVYRVEDGLVLVCD